LIEEKEERGKTGMYSFWKLKKKNVEEDEMTSITSTRNESCWTWEWMCNCRRSEARGPLSLPAGEDGQDHNQLRATQIKKIKKRGRRIVLERHFKNKKKKELSLRHGLGDCAVAPVPSTSGTLACDSARFTDNRHVAFGHSGRSRSRLVFHRHFSRRSSVSVFIGRCSGRPRSRSCFIPFAGDFRHDYQVVTLDDVS
jgi:hypothetical protein